MSDNNEQLPPNWAIDLPSERDFLYEEVQFGADTIVPVKFPYEKLVIQNQAADPVMLMSCTRQWICHINNAQNILEAERMNRQPLVINVKELWLERITERPSVQSLGDSLQSAMDQMLAKWFIAGYAKVLTVEAMISAIERGDWIYTGSKDGDWKAVRDRKVYATWWDNGHAFCVVDVKKDKKMFVWINSYGANNGYFEIPFDLVGSLYSKYAISDARDEMAVRAYLELKKKMRLTMTAESQFSELLVSLREQTGKLPLYSNYKDGFGITKELTEIGILRHLVNTTK